MADLDCSKTLQPCNCTANQVCIQIGRSSTECAKNTCVDKGSSGAGGGRGGSGGSSVGAVAGQAVGGVIGGLVIIVAVYWFWWRKRRQGSLKGSGGFFTTKASSGNGARSPSANNGGLRDFRMGGGKSSPAIIDEKQHQHSRAPAPSPLRNVLSTLDEGEEDAQDVIKRQSFRFDPSNNGTRTSRRSLSNTNAQINGDNPFDDHHSENDRSRRNTGNSYQDGEEDDSEEARRERQSNAASLSDFSFRSSHSTNIIPIAYIPAHSSQASTIDMTNARGSGATHDHGRPQSISTLGGGGGATTHYGGRDSSVLPPRGNRASVPLSLRSTSTNGNTMHDSMAGATFSRLFDRRASATSPGIRNDNRSTVNSPGGMLEIIAPNMGAASPPALTTPTMTKDGRPIRPPRAPGLDLKLPTPDAISPPTSPGFPWNNNSGNGTPSTGASLTISPGGANAKHQFGVLSPTLSSQQQPPSGRETLLSPTFGMHNGRTSGYSTFSQSTDNSGSHMSYILEAPQIVTPVSAGGVQVQTLSRAAPKTIKFSHSNSGNSLHVGSEDPSSPGSGVQYASSPLARGQSSSPLADNPFDDDAAVRIAMPTSQAASPTLPHTPTFGNAAPQQGKGSSRPGTSNEMRDSLASTNAGRRDSDLSIFTSSEAHKDYEDDTGMGMGGVKRTARNSFASSFASSSHRDGQSSSTRQSTQQMRAPSPSSFAGTTGHSASSGKSIAPSIHSSQSADEVILSPPNRPFAPTAYNDMNGGIPDSRHTSAALSMRSGYGSVLDGIPFNLSLGNDARNSQASEAGTGSHVSVPFHFGSGVPLPGRNISMNMGEGGGIRDSSATFRTSVASSSGGTTHNGTGSKRDTSYSVASASTHHGGNDKRDTSYSLASEWNGAFAGMPIQMGGIAEEAVPEVPSMYVRASTADDASAPAETKGRDSEEDQQTRDERYSSDSLAMAAAIARQFDERKE